MQYMWCTPGTETYIFFGTQWLTPPPLNGMSFTAAIQETLANGTSYQADIEIPDGAFTSDPAGTQVQFHVENSGKNGKLTWGILNSALAGLQQYSEAYQNNLPIIFQVNDGQWGEVGRGYVAFLREETDGSYTCLLEIYQGKETDCSKLDKEIS